MKELKIPAGVSVWAGMDDYILKSPDDSVSAILTYIGEPPHGDSYHYLEIKSVRVPGYVWGCTFAFSADSRYLVFGWMQELYDRKTMVLDCTRRRYFILPQYINCPRVNWPIINEKDSTISYSFSGKERWTRY